MSQGVLYSLCGVLAFAAMYFYAQSLAARRERFIRGYIFKVDHFDKLCQKHPDLDLKGCHMAARALRQFFLAHLRHPKEQLGMPSRVADDLWHEFILDTREYTRFCRRAFGRYFHHVPATAMYKGEDAAEGLRRTWRLACMEENIGWRKPTRLPLLFAIDDKLGIAKAQRYTLNDHASRSPARGGSQQNQAARNGRNGHPMGFGGPINLTHIFGCVGGGLTKGDPSLDQSAGLFGGGHDFGGTDSGGGGDGGGGCGGGCGGG
ncbi:MAG: glycine-rich domain-containing protein [Burkholderiales bacterium]